LIAKKKWILELLLCALAAIVLGQGAAWATDLQEAQDFGTNPGNLGMKYFAPENLAADAPLVLVLHGCNQSVAAIADAGWLDLAEERGFVLLFPEQKLFNNPSGCFNWAGEYGDLSNLERGEGENESIMQMVLFIQQLLEINSEKIFISGFSSGGAMASIMLATWPEVFDAGAIMSGITYACSMFPWEAQPCIMPGIDRGPAEWASRVRDAFPEYEGTYPRLSLWQNARDPVVGVLNLSELVEQWTEVHGIDRVPDEELASGAASILRYQDESGVVRVESWLIEQAGHGIPIDEASGCGISSTYVLDTGVCFAKEALGFFGIEKGNLRDELRPGRPQSLLDGTRFEQEGTPIFRMPGAESEEEQNDAEGGCQSTGSSAASSGLWSCLVLMMMLGRLRQQ